MRGRVIVVCSVVLVLGGVLWWHKHDNESMYDGSVQRRNSGKDNGATSLDTGKKVAENVDSTLTPSRSDTIGAVDGGDVGDKRSRDRSTQASPVAQTPYRSTNGQAGPTPQTSVAPTPGQTETPQISSGLDTITMPAPAAGSQAPNAPNGMRFSGTGVYQWYRQGNLTYRLNTQSGTSCIVYATLKEWRKPDVYKNGCRASS